MDTKLNVAVLGSTGYVGLELVKILIKHPNVNINFLGSENHENLNIDTLDSKIVDKNLPKLQFNKIFTHTFSDCVFLCLPHGISNTYVKKLFGKIKIIDLSADFRLDSIELYFANYDNEHSCPNLLNKFVYGLPEINQNKILKSSNIAIPGCYPTSVLIPLIPLLKSNLIDGNNVIIDSKSGYSGAGKRFNIEKIKGKNDLNFYNYNTNQHRHICEIEQELNKHSDKKINFSFNPHLLPVFRGMMSTIYLDLKENVNINDVNNVLINFTNQLKFVRFLDQEDQPDFYSIQNNNNCIIKSYSGSNASKIIIVSLIDNLLKGAAGQAVQCFNISLGLDEELSLIV